VILVLADLQHKEQLKLWNNQRKSFDVWHKRELKENFAIPKTIVSRILIENLGMSHVCAKFVLRVLRQKIEVVENILKFIRKNSELLKMIITDNEI